MPDVERWTIPGPVMGMPPLTVEVVPAAAFDAVVAERDEARRKLGIAIDVTHEMEDEKIALADRLAKWERGVWPSTEAQHGVLLDQIKELVAERDAAITAGQKLADALADDFAPDHISLAALAAWRAVSGSSEPRKENE